jgi:hypothetical protein
MTSTPFFKQAWKDARLQCKQAFIMLRSGKKRTKRDMNNVQNRKHGEQGAKEIYEKRKRNRVI